MRYTYLIFVINLFSSLAFSQVRSEDVVEALKTSNEAIHDSLHYELFRSILYSNGDLEDAKSHALKAYKFSKKYGHHFLFAKSCRALGMLNNRLQNLDSARYYYYEGIKTSQQFDYSNLLVYTTNDLGLHFENQDVYDSALKYYHISLENAKKLKMNEDVAFALNNIGLVFYYLNNYKEALQNLEASIEIKKKYNIESLHLSLMNMGLVYNDQGRYKEALMLLNEVLSEYSSECSEFQLADLYFSLAYANYYTGSYDKSALYLKEAYRYGQASGNRKV